MKKQKLIRILFIILFSLVVLTSLTQVVYGINTGITGSITPDEGYYGMFGKALGVVQYLCYGAAVIIVMIVGVQFMTAAPEGKAEVKKKSVYMAIGAGIMFTIGTVAKIIQNISTQTFGK